jgi:hypothetical protein
MFWSTNKKILKELETLNLRIEFLTMAFLASTGNDIKDNSQNLGKSLVETINENKNKTKEKEFEYMDSNTSIEEDIKKANEQDLQTKEKDFFEYNDDSGTGIREDLIEDNEEINV